MKSFNLHLVASAIGLAAFFTEVVDAQTILDPKEITFEQFVSLHTQDNQVIEGTYKVSNDALISGGFVFCTGLVVRQGDSIFFAHINPAKIGVDELATGLQNFYDAEQDAEVLLFNTWTGEKPVEDKRYLLGDPDFLNWQATDFALQALKQANIDIAPKIYEDLAKGELQTIIVPPHGEIQSVWYDSITPAIQSLLNAHSFVQNPLGHTR